MGPICGPEFKMAKMHSLKSNDDSSRQKNHVGGSKLSTFHSECTIGEKMSMTRFQLILPAPIQNPPNFNVVVQW